MPSIGTQTKLSYNRKSKKFVSRRNKRMPFSKKQVKAIKKISELSSELKSKVITGNDASITQGSPYVVTLNSFGIAQGTDNDERIGEDIRIKDLWYKIHLYGGSAGLYSGGHCYSLTVLQHDGNEALTASSQISPLEFFPSGQDSEENYKILFHKVYTLNPSSVDNKYHSIKINGKKLRKVFFDDATTTVKRNSISIILKPLTSTVNRLEADWTGRLRWYD